MASTKTVRIEVKYRRRWPFYPFAPRSSFSPPLRSPADSAAVRSSPTYPPGLNLRPEVPFSYSSIPSTLALLRHCLLQPWSAVCVQVSVPSWRPTSLGFVAEFWAWVGSFVICRSCLFACWSAAGRVGRSSCVAARALSPWPSLRSS